MVDRLPCPFCGSAYVFITQTLRDGCQAGEPDAYAYSVRCGSCAAEGPWFKMPGNAERGWNTRSKPRIVNSPEIDSGLTIVTAEELDLLREQADCILRSYRHPGVPDREQPPEWHEGNVLHALADRLEAAVGENVGGDVGETEEDHSVVLPTDSDHGIDFGALAPESRRP